MAITGLDGARVGGPVVGEPGGRVLAREPQPPCADGTFNTDKIGKCQGT